MVIMTQEINIGDTYIDTLNDFNNPNFKFIKGQTYNPELATSVVLNKTENSVCMSIKKFPLKVIKQNGNITNPIDCISWVKMKREHEFDIIFSQRFKKI